MEYTKKHLKALADRVYQYERAIYAASDNKANGIAATLQILEKCNVCKTVSYDGRRDCEICALGPDGFGCIVGGGADSRGGLWRAVDYELSPSRALRRRLRFILKKCAKNGIIFE